MATLNKRVKTAPIKTHEGAPAVRITSEKMLRRSLMSCLLWEDQFYEDGCSIADRLSELVKVVNPIKVVEMMIEARNKMYLRHAPLLIATELARNGNLMAGDLNAIIQRADELCEFLAVYWRDGKCPLAGQVKKGLAKAFQKFDAYSLAKYNRDNTIKLRDVLFMVHAKPTTKEQAKIWKKLVDGTLESPDTWEVSLSGEGKDKKAKWERLLKETKLGGMALLRNLRNMKETGVSSSLVKQSIKTMKTDRILPFRFIAAAKYAPQWEPEIEIALFSCLEEQIQLRGKTIILIDISGSMDQPLSSKSEMDRLDAACGLAICAREMCEDVEIYSFSEKCKQIAPRRGFALRDAIVKSQMHGRTYLGNAIGEIRKTNIEYDRLIVITDEQTMDRIPSITNKAYMLNVGSYQNGVGYGKKWCHIDGWSDSVLRFIAEYETL